VATPNTVDTDEPAKGEYNLRLSAEATGQAAMSRRIVLQTVLEQNETS
jgi:hypothetical protein